jgi:hypothetical protein
VNLEIGGAELACARDVVRRHVIAALRRLTGYHEQRLELVRNRGVLEIALHLHDQVLVAVQVMRGNGAVNGVAVSTVVL